MTTTIRSTCCYCGVGCGVLIETDGQKVIGIQGDPQHPANFGRLCTKGMTLPLTASHDGRLLHPEMRLSREEKRQPVGWDAALDHVADKFAQIIAEHGPDAVAFYLSGQLLTEDYYVFNKLAKGLIGTANIDTNSRLCMSSAVTGYKKAFGVDGPPCSYEDLELADTVLFAGSNMAYAHPVLFRRLEAAKAARPETRWIVIDPRRTDTAALADLHLAIQPGTDVALFNGMLHYLIWEDRLDHELIAQHTEGFSELRKLVREYTPKMAAEICGIPEADLVTAAEWFADAKGALSLYCMGLNQSSHGTDKNVALINLHLATGQLGRPGAGPFSLTGQPNAMGGREVGGMATMLASHRDLENTAHRADLAQVWGIDANHLPMQRGKTAVELFDAIKAGEIKAVWIACTNPAHSMPDIGSVRAALETAELVVLQEVFTDTDTMAFADVVLPATTWGEKEGTVTNTERRISRVRPAVAAVGEAKGDWWIATQFAQKLQARLQPHAPALFDFATPEAVFNDYRATTAGRDLDITGLSYALLEDKPQQWPLPAGSSEGTSRLYTDHVYQTASGKAQFNAVKYLPVAEAVSSRYPFRLLTGRLRDQWHGMSRTGRVPQLFEHTPEARLGMHADDMSRRNLKDGDLVKLESKRGQLIVAVEASHELQSGSVFLPMHWNGQFMQAGGANEVTIGAVDPSSFQPELKHAAVRIEKIDLPWTCLIVREGNVEKLMHRLRPLLSRCRWASLSLIGREHPMIALRVADHGAPEGWFDEIDEILDFEPGPNTLHYRDSRRGVDKVAMWSDDGRLIGLKLAGETAAQDWLLALMKQGGQWTWPRQWVFLPNATPPSGAPGKDRTVCNCLGVTESAIKAEFAKGCDLITVQDKLKCGTSCGSCIPELKRLAAG
ncbi:MAG: nitrate reductase [Proteobacteria bacterium]|nr:nitrate reductase [Pseudomonadota bacterium]